MRDKVGDEITVGCWIAYGHALGRCAGLRIGKVLAFKEWDNLRFDNSINTYEPKKYRITVIGIDDDWCSQEPHVNDRKGTLQFPNRTLVLSDSQVPELYKNLMSNAELINNQKEK
jgi:hypothetical protein